MSATSTTSAEVSRLRLHGFDCRGPASTRESALPADASCEDLDVDPALPFLDGYVAEALGNGAAPYISQQDRFSMGFVRPSHHDEVRDSQYPLGLAPDQISFCPSKRRPLLSLKIAPVRECRHVI